MLLTPRAEYALRALAVLASEPAERWVAVAELAERAHVPPAFLSKVMRQLVVAEIARGQKGHGGGFQLARPPHRIRVSDVLAAIDFTLAVDHCAFGWEKCSEGHPCPLHGMYGELKATFRQWSERSTLADADPRGHIAPLRRQRRGRRTT